MIFVTIGFQFPFDRLIKEIDRIAPCLNNISVLAQVSNTNYQVQHIKCVDFVSPSDFTNYFSEAQIIISHAGMGTIITALEMGKPIIVMPRLKKHGEVTTDHQLATAKIFEKLNYIYVAYNETELQDKILKVLNGDLRLLKKINKYASSELLNSIKSFMSEIK